MKAVEAGFEQLVRLDQWLIDRHHPLPDGALDPMSIPGAAEVAAGWADIREELDALLAMDLKMPRTDDVIGEEQGAEGTWTTYMLCSFGTWLDFNCRRCPRTTELVKRVPGVEIAGFTVLEAGAHIPRHKGPYRALRYQLGVRVPEPWGSCRLQIGDEMVVWEDGKSLAFDDGVEHEAWNDSDEPRYVLFVQTTFALPGVAGRVHAANHRVLGLAGRPINRRAAELDFALNGSR